MAIRAAIVVSAITFLSAGNVCACALGPSFEAFEYDYGQAANYKGPEKLRYFIGEVVTFNSKSAAPEAYVKVMREYALPEISTELVTALPRLATMKVKPVGPCVHYNLNEGDIGVFASYEENGVLWLASRTGHGF
jgi:hypothetical protein